MFQTRLRSTERTRPTSQHVDLIKEGERAPRNDLSVGSLALHVALTEDGHPGGEEVFVDEGADLALVEAAHLRRRTEDLDGAVPLVLARPTVVRHVGQVDPVLEHAPHRLRPANANEESWLWRVEQDG